jgi:hypothetical protein
MAGNIFGQLTVSGTVYDSTRTVPVKGVLVQTKFNHQTITDSLGQYTILVAKNDSIDFTFRNKSTPKFAVSDISNLTAFDIAIKVRVYGRFKTLKEVTITSKNYHQDSLDNRDDYKEFFNYSKPGFQTSVNDNTGNAGLNLDDLINVFRFKRNKDLRYMQQRVMEQEQDNYVNYKFNKRLVKRITAIDSADIDNFMKQYRPSFQFVQYSSEADFYQYILDASYEFIARKKNRLQDSLKATQSN